MIAAQTKFQEDHGLVPCTVDQTMLDALKAAGPLITAVHRADLAAARTLLASGANPNASDTFLSTVGHLLWRRRIRECRRCASPARLWRTKIDLKGQYGKTPLNIAVAAGCSICSTRTGNMQVAELLRGRGAKE